MFLHFKRNHQQLCDTLQDGMGDMHQVSALHLRMILEYYDDVLKQANASFICAVAIAVLGFAVLVGTMYFAIRNPMDALDVGTIGIISGALIEFISAIVFFIYKRATEQFSAFHICLERTNRYLTAYRINDEIDGINPQKDKARRDLACIIANAPMIGQKEAVVHAPVPPMSAPTGAPAMNGQAQTT